MLGFQAAGSAPLVLGAPVPQPETVATAIRIGNPASGEGALTAVKESGGHLDTVTDEEILAAQRWLASREGLFVEPASAASIAGLLKCVEDGGKRRCERCPLKEIEPESVIVCTVTGHGLKDPDVILKADFPLLKAKGKKADILEKLDL